MKEAISEFIKFVTILLILITGILIMKHYEYKNFKLLLDSNKIEVTNDFNIEGLNGVEIPKKTKYEVDRRKDILSNMKTYNEILYQKQSDTFQVIIYILAIFSIVADTVPFTPSSAKKTLPLISFAKHQSRCSFTISSGFLTSTYL